MKKWEKPEFQSVETIAELCPGGPQNTGNPSGFGGGKTDDVPPTGYVDLGTCHNDYWAGNGLSKEEAIANNPYWRGGWGNP